MQTVRIFGRSIVRFGGSKGPSEGIWGTWLMYRTEHICAKGQMMFLQIEDISNKKQAHLYARK